jgi:hypothetical protein
VVPILTTEPLALNMSTQPQQLYDSLTKSRQQY